MSASPQPITFDPFDSGGRDPELLQQMLLHEPIHRTEAGMLVVSRYRDVREVNRRPQVFSSAPNHSEAFGMSSENSSEAGQRMTELTAHLPISAEDLMTARTLVAADPPRHTDLRRVINRAFLPNQMQKWDGFVQKRVDALMEGIDGTQPFDAIERLGEALPVAVLAEILSLTPREYSLVTRWTYDMFDAATGPNRGTEAAAEQLFSAFSEFVQHFSVEVQDRRENPRDDIISLLVQKQEEVALSNADVVFFLQTLMEAGILTTMELIGNMIVKLYENPDQLKLLNGDLSLIDNAIEETLRIQAPAQMGFRVALEDTDINGYEVPAGTVVIVLWVSANHDSEVFPDPLRYDITRANASSHVSFGHGIHYCIGAALARLEVRLLMRQLVPVLTKMELGAPPERALTFLTAGFKSIKLVPAD